MNLIVDIGNTFIKLAIFDGDELKYVKRFKHVLVGDIKSIRKKYPFAKAILSSVRKKHPLAIQHLIKNYDVLELTHKTKMPLTIHYDTPQTLGLDRLAAVAGAHSHHKNKNCLVIDIGTCITFDYIEKDGHYYGGNISPGIELRLKAMHQFTASLPLVKRSNNEDILGKSTKMALQNGAVKGIKYEIESFIKTLTKNKGKFTVILTGGDASYFGEMIESKIFVNPNLVLNGLNEILKYNNL